jgi:hypothetical protein
MPQSPAQRSFADAYYGDSYGAIGGQEPTIRPDDGPASHQLYAEAARAVAAARSTGLWNVADPVSRSRLYDDYVSNDDLVRNIFARPNPIYFGFLTQAAAARGGDELLRAVAVEHGTGGLFGFGRYVVRHPLSLLMGPPNPFVGLHFLMKYYRYKEFLLRGQAGVRDLFIHDLRADLIQESYGPAVRMFAESLRFFVDALPQYLGPDYLRDFGGPGDLKTYLVENPYFSEKYSGGMMYMLYAWLSDLYGEERAGRLMGDAALDVTLHHPTIPGFLLGDFLAATTFSGNTFFSIAALADFGPAFSGTRTASEAWLRGTVESGRTTELSPTMADKLGNFGSRSMFAQNVSALLELEYGFFKWVKPLMFLGTLVFAVPLIVGSRGGPFVAFLTLVFFASAAAWTVVMIMPGSDSRHEDVYAFIPLMICALGCAGLPRFVRISRGDAIA